MGNISKRPISMSAVSTKVDKLEYIEKFCVGPTFARPGPILLNAASTAEKFVVKSKLSMLIINTETAKIARYAAMKTFTARTTSCSIGLPFIVIT